MADKKPGALEVILNGRTAGHLIKEKTGAIEFRYAQEWLDWEYAMPVSLSLPLREERYVGADVDAVFDNLLPDNRDIRRHIAERTAAEGIDAFSLLSAIGRDCVGALQFMPPNAEAEYYNPANIRSEPLTGRQIGKILANLKNAPLGLGDEAEFRISLAGVQEKTALLRRHGKWELPLGATPTTHILKPAIGRLDNGLDMRLSIENEHFCMRFLRALGIPVAHTEIESFGKIQALVVERFDRRLLDDRLLRLPQEDLCQALGVAWSRKYENEGGPGIARILDFLQASDEAENDRLCFMKAQIVFWLLGATDGHAKNFSIHLASGGRFRLAPFYDVLSLQPNVDNREIPLSKYRMAMAVGNNRHYAVNAITRRHYYQTADRCGISRNALDAVFESLIRIVPDALERTIDGMPRNFPASIADSIAKAVSTRLGFLA